MWDLPGPGIKPVSSALGGRFFTTEPPEKPLPGIYSNENACQQLAHKESLSFSHINILGCLMKGLFFQISKFCTQARVISSKGCRSQDACAFLEAETVCLTLGAFLVMLHVGVTCDQEVLQEKSPGICLLL